MSFGQRASPPQIFLTTAEPRRRARRLLTPYLLALAGVVGVTLPLWFVLGRTIGDLSLTPAVIASMLLVCVPVMAAVDFGLSLARVYSIQAYAMSCSLLSAAFGLALNVLFVLVLHENLGFLIIGIFCAVAGAAGGAALGHGRKPRR